MSTHQEEEGETIEFYKIQVMEKDREISDFQAKIKKIDFKHNRQIKQAKVAEERAKALLKDEKAKVDKLSMQAKQNQQQNNLLQMRLNELKEAKDKEVQEIRAQYNFIKQEIRSYQKILPTHTFLIEIDKSINQLPAYEDIFMNLKDKALQLQELNHKFEAFKSKTEQDIDSFRQNEQSLKSKKIEAQFSLKEMLSKVIDYEHVINDLKILSEEHQAREGELNDLLTVERLRSTQLQQNLKQFQSKMQQLEHAFANQIQNKETDIKGQFQQQLQRLQQENRSLESRLELKESSYINQISIYEEEISSLQNRLQADKEKFQEQLNQAREACNQLKKQLDKSRKYAQDLSHKNQELVDNLKQVSLSNEQLEEKVRQMKRKQELALRESMEKLSNNQRKSQKSIEQAQRHHQQLQMEIAKLKQALTIANEQKQVLQEEVNQLRNQFQAKRGSFNERKPMGGLDIPFSSELEYFQKERRRSMESGYEEDNLVQLDYKSEVVKQRKRSEQVLRGLQTEVNEGMKAQLSEFKHTIQLLQSKCQKYQELYRQKQQSYTRLQQSCEFLQIQRNSLLAQLSSKSQRITALSSENTALSSQKQNLLSQKSNAIMLIQKVQNSYKQQLTTLQEQIEKVKMTNQVFSRSNIQLEQVNQGLIKKMDLYKTKSQSQQQQIKFLTEQSKKDRQSIKTQRQELKHQKQIIQLGQDKQSKSQKDVIEQIQAIRDEKQRIKAQGHSRQKKLLLEIDRLNNDLVLEEKLKQQIKALNDEIKKRDDQILLTKQQIHEVSKQKQELKRQIQLLQNENKSKDRQNEIISGSLDRQRRERTLRSVPSLQSLNGDLQQAEQATFNDMYLMVTKKEGEINMLQRQISDLKEQVESMRLYYSSKVETIEGEQKEYIQTIIQMKMRCAQSQMKASQKQYLYSMLKKRMDLMTSAKV